MTNIKDLQRTLETEQQQNNQVKQEKDMNRYFSKGEIQVANGWSKVQILQPSAKYKWKSQGIPTQLQQELLSYSSHQAIIAGENARKRNSNSLLVGIWTSATIMEVTLEISSDTWKIDLPKEMKSVYETVNCITML